MTTPSTPRQKRLAVTDGNGVRASSTPPKAKLNPYLLAPAVLSPSSRHSSPGINRTSFGRPYADDMIPRRLTASPVARIKSKDKTRKRLPEYHTLDDAVKLLKDAKNIVVLSGAGISTSLDIPDFRSDGGFYSRLSSSIGLTTPEEFFSLEFFNSSSEQFWDNVKPLLPKHAKAKDGSYQFVAAESSDQKYTVPRFSKTHAFLSLLHNDGKLLTNYTQNIDNLEYASGIRDDRVVKCHGSWDTASCLDCGKTISARKYLPIVWQSGYPRCNCAADDLARPKKNKLKAKKRKRAVFEGDSDHSSDDGTAIPKGLFKPDITFFGEGLPEYYLSRLEEDRTEADLILVLGTSLKVRPVKTMVVDFPPNVPQIWINRDRFSGWKCDMPGVQFDIELLGDCDTVVEELCRRAGYPLHKYTWHDDRTKSETEPKHQRSPSAEPLTDHGTLKRNGEHDLQAGQNLAHRHKQESPVNLIATNGVPLTKKEKHGREAGTVTKIEANANGRTPATESTVRVEEDLDADWRWRFTKRRIL